MSIVTRPEWAPVTSMLLQLEPIAARSHTADDQDQAGEDPPSAARRTRAEAVRAFAAGQPISIYNAFGRMVEVDQRPTLDGRH